jgi:hypothetical protein
MFILYEKLHQSILNYERSEEAIDFPLKFSFSLVSNFLIRRSRVCRSFGVCMPTIEN